MDEKEAREILTRLAEHLRKQKLPLLVEGQDVPLAWAAYAADAIEKYLRGESASLDAAFGLNRDRGRPSNPAHREGIARQAIAMQIDGVTLKKIACVLAEKKIFVDASDIKRYVDEFRPKIVNEETLIEAHAEDIIRDITSGEK